jgi:carbon storage regulator CsrA
MLIIGRLLEEEVWIEDRIRIKVLGIKDNYVKLGFEAPREVLIERSERRKLAAKLKIASGKSKILPSTSAKQVIPPCLPDPSSQ